MESTMKHSAAVRLLSRRRSGASPIDRHLDLSNSVSFTANSNYFAAELGDLDIPIVASIYEIARLTKCWA